VKSLKRNELISGSLGDLMKVFEWNFPLDVFVLVAKGQKTTLNDQVNKQKVPAPVLGNHFAGHFRSVICCCRSGC